MAKGNDGNLLQHTIECELAWQLHCLGSRHKMHLFCTHGMAPSEPFESTQRYGRKLRDAIAKALQQELPEDSSAVLHAYRDCHASAGHYPNTAELVASITGRRNLVGSIFDTVEHKLLSLKYAWTDTQMEVESGSWRNGVAGLMQTPVDYPWLIAMDPFTFRSDADFDDNGNFYPKDFDLLIPVVNHFITEGKKSGVPGAFVVFCYSVEKRGNRAAGFYGYDEWPEHTQRFAGNFSGVHSAHFEVKRNMYDVGFAISTDAEVLKRASSAWGQLNQ